MLGLARFAMKSPLHAGILAALSSIFPVGIVISAPLVGLTTLRFGFSSGTRILGMALLGGVIGWLVFKLPFQLLILPLIAVLALLLRESDSWGRTLVSAAYVGLVLSFGLELFFGDFFDWIAQEWSNASANLDEQTALAFTAFAELRPIYRYVAANGLMEMTLLFLLLARYWQAALFNPGGLKAELHTLRLSRAELMVLIVGAFIAAVTTNMLAIALFSFPFIFAGMALIHGIVAKLKLGGQWLVAIYIALVMFNQIIVPFLVLVVLVDAAVDIRSRIPERNRPDNE